MLHSRSGPVSSVSSVRDVALRSVSSVRDLAACMSSLTLITLLVWFKRPCTVCPPSCCGKGGGFNEVYQNRVRFCPAEALHIFVMPRKRKLRLKGQRTTFGKIWVNLPLPCPAKDVGWRKRSGLPLQCRQHQMSDVLRNAVNTFYISSVAERVTTVSMWDSRIPGWTREQELAWAKRDAQRLAQNYINTLDDFDWWGFTFTLGLGWKKALPSLWEKLLLQGPIGMCPKREGAPKEKGSDYVARYLARERDTD